MTSKTILYTVRVKAQSALENWFKINTKYLIKIEE